jgi:hypothetical protein
MRFPGRPRGPGCRQHGGNVGGEGVQFRVGREHLADPQIKLVLGQPSLHERGLERVEHLLAVGPRRYQAAAVARACCYLVSGHNYLTGSPMSTIYGKRSVPVFGQTSADLLFRRSMEGVRQFVRRLPDPALGSGSRAQPH